LQNAAQERRATFDGALEAHSALQSRYIDVDLTLFDNEIHGAFEVLVIYQVLEVHARDGRANRRRKVDDQARSV
jgi:hypothetical protein